MTVASHRAGLQNGLCDDAMSKAEKKTKSSEAKEVRSVLQIAFQAFERGDAVWARAMANEVLAGRTARDEAAVAKSLAHTLSAEGAPVDESPQAVAQELIDRTTAPLKPVVFAGLAAFVFVLLVALAASRYSGV